MPRRIHWVKESLKNNIPILKTLEIFEHITLDFFTPPNPRTQISKDKAKQFCHILAVYGGTREGKLEHRVTYDSSNG